jgi:peptidoglycan/xylan/chitin deacetylase (PgdA/CDA1 family)
MSPAKMKSHSSAKARRGLEELANPHSRIDYSRVDPNQSMLREQSIRMFKFAGSLCFYALTEPYRAIGRKLGWISSRTTVGLFYHQVKAEERERFARQMTKLLRYATPVGAGDSNPTTSCQRSVFVTADDGWKSFVDNALPEMERRSIPGTIFVIADRLGESLGDSSDRIISESELRDLRSRPVTIGSHTLTHARLTTLSDEATRRELLHSRKKLEATLERKVDLFCFPFGAYDDRILRLCGETGYRRVFLCRPESESHSARFFIAGRIRADPSDWPIEFYLKLVGAYSWLAGLLRLKKKIVSWLKAPRRESPTPLETPSTSIESVASRSLGFSDRIDQLDQ